MHLGFVIVPSTEPGGAPDMGKSPARFGEPGDGAEGAMPAFPGVNKYKI